jgi:hypothetical protein
MKFYLSDAWPAPGHVRKVFNLEANPESEAFFTEAVYDQLSADAIAGLWVADLPGPFWPDRGPVCAVSGLRISTREVVQTGCGGDYSGERGRVAE